MPENENVLDQLNDDQQNNNDQQQPQQQDDKPAALTHQDLDTVLRTRDEALIGAVQKNMIEMFQSIQQNASQNRKEADGDDPDQKELDSITQDEFYRDPVKTMNKFTEIKNRLLMKSRKGDQQPNPNQRPTFDPMAMNAYVETQKMKLRDRVGSENFKKYEAHIDQVIQRTDPRVLAMPETFDALWRLTKSYVDDAENDTARKREERNAKANLDAAGRPIAAQPKVKLNEDQAFHAEALGLSADDYEKYSKPEEVEIGANRKKK